jgi:hypothetical protein
MRTGLALATTLTLSLSHDFTFPESSFLDSSALVFDYGIDVMPVFFRSRFFLELLQLRNSPLMKSNHKADAHRVFC